MLLALIAALAVAQAGAPVAADDDTTTIPPIYWIEVLHAPDRPASLFCTPSGGGVAFADADGFGGDTVDATLEVVLWSDQPGWGTPIAHFPREDMWLEASDDGLVLCVGGTIADADTDAAGRTRWALPLRVGGRLDRGAGAWLQVVVVGDPFQGTTGIELSCNSADINGDLVVNLTDIGMFASDLFGAYAYRSDFVWDGVINISDAGRLAASRAHACP